MTSPEEWYAADYSSNIRKKGNLMFVEERIYTMAPGNVHPYLNVYASQGLPIAGPILGNNLVGMFYSEIGDLNTVVSLFSYQSLDDRQRRRAELAKSPEWQAYAKQATTLVMKQQNRILVPAPFSPIR